MRTAIIIPARLAAQRLPRKPLAPIGDVPLVVRVAMQAHKVADVDDVIIATDAVEIREAAQGHGIRCEMTRDDHPSGTDRVAEVAARIGAERIINLQGDEPFIVPADVEGIEIALRDPKCDMATLAMPITKPEELDDPNVVKVVSNDAGGAMYFSRAPIPFCREGGGPRRQGRERGQEQTLGHRHVGVYGYQRSALQALCAAPPHWIECQEKLEQLRALAMGLRIRVLPATTAGRGIDTAEDLGWARERYEQYGEAAFPPPSGERHGPTIGERG